MRKIEIDGDIIILGLIVIAVAVGSVCAVVADVNEKRQCNESYRACVENHGPNCDKVMEKCR